MPQSTIWRPQAVPSAKFRSTVEFDALAHELAALDVRMHRPRTIPDPAAFIAEVRARHNLSQREFAGALGLDVRTLQNWEQGRNRPDAAVLEPRRAVRSRPGAGRGRRVRAGAMIVCFGSINLDLIFPVPTLPQAGQTVLGRTMQSRAGGEGCQSGRCGRARRGAGYLRRGRRARCLRRAATRSCARRASISAASSPPTPNRCRRDLRRPARREPDRGRRRRQPARARRRRWRTRCSAPTRPCSCSARPSWMRSRR